ncbi:hypothetical protein COLO4_36752 [Corchorus olitorius]|uniref:Uncharacterized protein n=1 Tax=Corchorus olitorius TaxID=93759 RepID=A0A1R3G5M5_9ROSI|nr:hypothetical protein COLO4_36752 [Corchorus olitorius]
MVPLATSAQEVYQQREQNREFTATKHKQTT